jgi:hypothetical protein
MGLRKGRLQAGLFIAWTAASGVLENRGKNIGENILGRPELSAAASIKALLAVGNQTCVHMRWG